MYKITASLNGKNYNDEQIDFDDLLGLFKEVDSSFFEDGKDKSITFRMGPSFRKKNHVTGQKSESLGLRMPTVFTGNYNGTSVSIRYYESMSIQNENGVNRPVYQPSHITNFNNFEISVDPKVDKEIALFLMLHRRCGDSPLKDARTAAFYNVINHEKIAKDKNVSRRKRFAIIQEVLNEKDLAKIRRRAFGIKINGQQIHGVEAMDIEQMRDALLDIAERNPETFSDAYEDSESDMRGYARDAIAIGLVKINSISGNRKELVYEPSGSSLMKIGASNHVEALYSYMLQNEEHAKMIANSVDSKVNKFSAAEIMKKIEADKGEAEVLVKTSKFEDMKPEHIDEMDLGNMAQLALDTNSIYVDEMKENAIHYKLEGVTDTLSTDHFLGEKKEDWPVELALMLEQDSLLRANVIKELKYNLKNSK